MPHPRPRTLGPIVLLALLVAGPAAAQELDTDADDDGISDFAESSPYLTGMGVLSFQLPSQDQFAETFLTGDQFRTDVDPGLGLDIRAGYRLHPRWAVEASFNWMVDRDYESRDRASGGLKNEAIVRSWMTSGNVKYYLRTERFQPYLLAGAGYAEVRSKARQGPQLAFDRTRTEGGFVARFGAGFAHYLSWNTAINFEAGYRMPTGSISQTDQLFLNWGLTLRFFGSAY